MIDKEAVFLIIPLDKPDYLAGLLNSYATDTFEVMKFIEAMAVSEGKTVDRKAVFGKLLELMGVEEADKV